MHTFSDTMQALETWRLAHLRYVRQADFDLSTRQMTALLSIYTTEGPHTVRSLATEMQINKPAVTRALDKLQDLGLVKRKGDPKDKRSVIVQRTVKGSVFLTDFSKHLLEVSSTVVATPKAA